MTQRELGVRIGVREESAQTSISRWENNIVSPDANTLPLLAAVLGCQMVDFYRVAPRTAAPEEDTPTAGAA
jgi:transcriptional regulator with XRE-family HTH domain